MTDEVDPTLAPLMEQAIESGKQCAAFMIALEGFGFSRKEGIKIVQAWMQRPIPPPPIDYAAMNAVMANIFDKINPTE